MSAKYRYPLICFLFNCLFAVQFVAAQDSPDDLFSAETEKTEDLISLSDLASEIKEEEPKLKTVDGKGENQKFLKLENSFSRLTSSSKKLINETVSSLKSSGPSTSFEEINEAAVPLKETKESLEVLNNSASELITRSTEKLASLGKMRFRWENLIDDNDLNPALKQRIRAHIDQIIKAEEQTRPALTNSLELRKKIANLDGEISRSLVEVDTLGANFKARLFQAESSSPIDKSYWDQLSETTWSDLSKAFKTHNTEFLEYLDQHRDQLWLHLALTILIGSLVLKLKSSSFVQHAFPKLYDNPLVIIFTSTLLISYFVYTEADRRFFSIIGLLLIPPLTFLFCDVLNRRYRGVILLSALILAIDQVRNCIPELFELNQLLLFFQLLGSSWVCFRLFKICAARSEESKAEVESSDSEEDSKTKTEYQNRTLTRYWIFSHIFQFLSITFLVLLFSLSLGYWQLTSYLEQNLYGSIYTAILLYAGYQLLKGFVFAILLAPGIRDLNFVKSHRTSIRKNTSLLVAAGLVFGWLSHNLTRLGWYDQTAQITGSVMNSGVEIGDLSIKLKGVLLAGLILWVGLKASRLIRMFLAEDIYNRREFDTGLANTVDTSVHYLVLIGTILAAISAIGVGFQNVALIAGALSVGIGFGLQNIVNNFVSGIILLVERPVQVGDLILVGDTLGNVTRIGIRSCTVKTLDDADIIFPNASLVTERVVNWTHSSHRARISVSVGVAYGTDVEKCMRLLSETAKNLPFVLSHPEVIVLFTEFADSSLNFVIRAWVLNVNKRPEYKSELLVAIDQVFAENNISIPFPQRDVHLIESAKS